MGRRAGGGRPRLSYHGVCVRACVYGACVRACVRECAFLVRVGLQLVSSRQERRPRQACSS